MFFFDIKSIFFTALGYQMSYIEFFGVVTGLVAVWLSARANVWSWPAGIVNVVLAFFLYYQIQLYPDMFLQIFFFVTNVIGWWRWLNPAPEEADRKHELKVSYMRVNQLLVLSLIILIGTGTLGAMASRLHEWFPVVFPVGSAYPYVDSFIMVMSIATTFLMIQKKIECWVIWIMIDVVATILYYVKGVKFYSLEYMVFTVIAFYGLLNWIRECKSYQQQAV